MDLEFHQIDFRCEGLRTRHPRKERQRLASLADHGQLLPVVVVAADVPFVLVDGYKRLRALKRLAHDTVRATLWAIEEADTVVLEHVMRAGDPAGPLEQGWILDKLRARFGLSLEDLGRRFDKTPSWVAPAHRAGDGPGGTLADAARGRGPAGSEPGRVDDDRPAVRHQEPVPRPVLWTQVCVHAASPSAYRSRASAGVRKPRVSTRQCAL